MSRTFQAIRILQIVGGLNCGGTETWLLNVLRHIDRTKYRMDFVVHGTEAGTYEKEIRSLGSRILQCVGPDRPFSYARSLSQILKQYGPYDVVHSHVHLYSGWTLRIAESCGVPVRIAHCHTNLSDSYRSKSIWRKMYRRICKRLIARHCTLGLAASAEAAVDLFGPDWSLEPDRRVVHCGINLEPFRSAVDVSSVRAELEIPDDSFVMGHVGRFHAAKNHSLLLEITFELVKHDPNIRLLLIGNGPLQSEIRQSVSRLRLTKNVVFAGERLDIARILKGAVDVFAFPSLYEGLGLSLVEAQAAGIPCVVSDRVPRESTVIPQLVHRLSLDCPPNLWADEILRIRTLGAGESPRIALEKVCDSNFNLHSGISFLGSAYATQSSQISAAA